MFAYKEIVVEADVKRKNAIKVIKKSGLLKEENFRYYIDKMQKEEYLKRKYTEWENKSEGIVWPSKKKLRYVQSFEIPRE